MSVHYGFEVVTGIKVEISGIFGKVHSSSSKDDHSIVRR
ncbi:Hypothetical protein CpOVID04_1134 [Corynebacterium pseudotuberculosis]|nr:Hypothetical protein CpCAP1R_1121 [Corynebacterium pseudotuberculosis]QBS29401.1 Hypothetical protein CpCAP1C_1132 [Corynebacterium pseudotuberculosis]QCG72605.1 Hypothetical protein CpOVI1FL_1121 [Corynebacterium pseudotuberculosis]QDL40963.1 Hypothetical protein CpOVID04_1134 [Corynebacterium pseudotuberculosis]QDL43072.1 Hypothetical protein CpOVIZ01_1138 [Corynebacterium pseudotuberculosis]